MLVIRLSKTGKRNSPGFRIVVVEKTAAPQSGRFLEILGSYNSKGALQVKKDRIEHWLSQGAKASDTVHNLLVREGIIKGPKIKKRIVVKKKKKAETKEEPAASEAKKEPEKQVEPAAEKAEPEKKESPEDKKIQPKVDILKKQE